MTTCSEILLSGSLPTTLTETDGQKMIEKKERSAAAVAAATDSFAVPRFLSAIVLPNEVGLLIHSISPPDAQERRRRRGRKKGGRRRRRQVPRGRGLPTGKKEGRKLHVGEEARTKVSCPRFLSPMLSLHEVPTPRRHPESTRQTDNQPSNLPLTARWLTHCPPRSV